MRVAQFQIEQLGIDHPDYFPGLSTAYTDFEHKALGIGGNALEALNDAIEQVAQTVDDVTALEGVAAFDGITEEIDVVDVDHDGPEALCYVGILYNVEA